MVRGEGMTGDMFGNMSFDSSDEEEDAGDEVAVALAEDGLHISSVTAVDSGSCEVGYQPQDGPAILVRQIRERGLSFQLWPAATGMCRYLVHAYGAAGGDGGDGESLRGARVVELGAGTGMAGVMAARFGARVTLTDLPHVLQNLQSNVDLNLAEVEACGGSLEVQPLRWGVEEDAAEFVLPDLILASDCIYYDTLFEPFLQTLKWLCGIGTARETVKGDNTGPVVLLAHMRRWKKDGHFFRMAAKCFKVKLVHKHPLPENARTGVVVYKLTRKQLPSRQGLPIVNNEPGYLEPFLLTTQNLNSLSM